MLVTGALVITSRSAFAIGMDYPDGKPITGFTNWPNGLAKPVNVTNRVHAYCVNQGDFFASSGDAPQLTTFLSDLSRLDGVTTRSLILRDLDWRTHSTGSGGVPENFEISGKK